jgi:hypothetical protein
MVPSLRCLPLDLHVDPTVGKSPVGGCVIAIFILMSNIQGAIWWLIFKVLFESCLVSGQVFTIGDQLSKDIDIGMFWVLLVSYLFFSAYYFLPSYLKARQLAEHSDESPLEIIGWGKNVLDFHKFAVGQNVFF